MDKKLLLLVVVFTVVALAGSAAMALAPMGPPTADLKAGQSRVGVDYSCSTTSVKLKSLNTSWTGFDSDIIDALGLGDLVGAGEIPVNGQADLDIDGAVKDVKSNAIAANLGYGITDTWELFARLGAANGKFDEMELDDVSIEDVGFSGDYRFAYGLGTKVTFVQQEELDWGFLFQVNWSKTEDSVTEDGTVDDVDYTASVETKINGWEIDIAVGPTWKLAEGISIYGGPFLQFIGGDFDIGAQATTSEEDTVTFDVSGNIKEKSAFGGYVGVNADLSKNATLFGEVQFTGDAWAFATGVGWKI
jgi:opacity protein-like surface antigen